MAALAALVAISLLFGLSFSIARRPITLPSDVQALGLKDVRVYPIAVPVTSFRIFVSADLAEVAPDVSEKNLRAFSFRYPKVLSIPISTYSRSNKCKVYLEIDKKIKSNTIDCINIDDNTMVPFVFDQRLRPGQYDLDLHWTAEAGNEIAVHGFADAKDTVWLLADAGPDSISLGGLLSSWLERSPSRAVPYTACLLVLIVLLLVTPTNRALWVCPAVAVVAIFFINKPYSGFDETVHVDMLHRAYHDVPDEKRVDFWNRVRTDMLNSDFHRLHNSAIPLPNNCPHSILLKGCGYSDLPQNLYRIYGAIFGKLFSEESIDDPVKIRKIFGILNLAILIFTIVIVWFFIGRGFSKATLIFLVGYGGALAQLPTITNDIPMIMFGLLLLAAFTASVTNEIAMPKSMLFFGALGVIFLMKIDQSIYAAIPVLVGILAVHLLKNFSFSPQKSCSDQAGQSLLYGILAMLAYVFLILVLVSSVIYLLKIDVLGSREFLVRNLPNGELLNNLSNYRGKLEIMSAFWSYFKSLIGSYVWGHSYYHTSIYCAWGILLVLLGSFGFLKILASFNVNYRAAAVVLLILSLVTSAQILLSLTVLKIDANSAQSLKDAYLKSRFTAPGIGALLIMPMLGLTFCLEDSKAKWWVGKVVCAWGICLLAIYWPRFFLADLY